MAQAQPKASEDRHPEISAPLPDPSLDAQIARAEQRVVDRGARVRSDVARIVGTLRSKRGEAVRWAAIGVGAAAIGAIGYAGWRTWRRRSHANCGAKGDSPRPASAGPGFFAKIAAFARIATQWALRLHSEQGLTGSLFGMVRSALTRRAPASPEQPAAPVSPGRSDFNDAL